MDIAVTRPSCRCEGPPQGGRHRPAGPREGGRAGPGPSLTPNCKGAPNRQGASCGGSRSCLRGFTPAGLAGRALGLGERRPTPPVPGGAGCALMGLDPAMGSALRAEAAGRERGPPREPSAQPRLPRPARQGLQNTACAKRLRERWVRSVPHEARGDLCRLDGGCGGLGRPRLPGPQ